MPPSGLETVAELMRGCYEPLSQPKVPKRVLDQLPNLIKRADFSPPQQNDLHEVMTAVIDEDAVL